MERFRNVVVDQAGNVLPGAIIKVTLTDTAAVATIFSDRNGTTAKPNPFTVDPDGRYFFYAADGRYDVKIVYPGAADTFIYDILLQTATGGASGVSSVNGQTGAVTLDAVEIPITSGIVPESDVRTALESLNQSINGGAF